MKVKGELTDRAEAFASYYVGEARFNGTKAAILAGYKATSAPQMACLLLSDERVIKLVRESFAKLHLSSEEILARVADIARGSILQLAEERGGELVIDLRSIEKSGYGHLVKRIKIKTRRDPGAKKRAARVTEIDIELYSALDALQLAARAQGILAPRQEETEEVGGVIEVPVRLSPEEWTQAAQETAPAGAQEPQP